MKNLKVKKLLTGFLYLIIILSVSVILLETFSNYKVSKTIHLDAPVITKKSVVINAPIEKVWTIFTEVNNWDTWQKEIVDPKINGVFKPGTTFNWKSNGRVKLKWLPYFLILIKRVLAGVCSLTCSGQGR